MSTSSAPGPGRGSAENAERLTSGGVANRMQSREHRIAIYDAGFGGITWPVEYGGLGLTGAHQEAFTEEAANYPISWSATSSPRESARRRCSTSAARSRSGATSRTCSAATRCGRSCCPSPVRAPTSPASRRKAVLDGDEWVVNGQKVWTSGAMASEFAILIARSNPDVPKHQGLSMFIVDLKAPGVTIRPLKQMTGNDEFNEVFLDDVRLPADYLVGDEGRRLARAPAHADARAHGDRRGDERLAHGPRHVHHASAICARARGVDQNEGVRAALLDVYIKERLLELARPADA